jgi:hypothetical protein
MNETCKERGKMDTGNPALIGVYGKRCSALKQTRSTQLQLIPRLNLSEPTD